MKDVNTIIRERLSQLADEHGIAIAYACESGSRAWGFESRDSDYDVRFIYIHKPQRYLTVEPPRPTIEVMETVDGHVLDVVGWDVIKALQLLGKGNQAVQEWLESPIVYTRHSMAALTLKLQASRSFAPHRAGHYYRGLFRRVWHDDIAGREAVIPKRYLYALRSYACYIYCEKFGKRPPVPWRQTALALPTEIYAAALALVEDKAARGERDPIAPHTVLHPFLEEKVNTCRAGETDQGPTPASELDQTLHEIAEILWP